MMPRSTIFQIYCGGFIGGEKPVIRDTHQPFATDKRTNPLGNERESKWRSEQVG